MTAADSFALRGRDGVEVHVHRWLPAGSVRGVVQIAHGMAEHGARYGRLATALTDAGFAVYADDHRGHGRTAAEADLGHFADEGGFGLVLDDLAALGRHARGAHPGAKLVLLGHSMGSFFAQRLLQLDASTCDVLVLSGSNAPGSVLERLGIGAAKLERARQGKRGKSALLAKLSFGSFNDGFKPARTDYDWLSRDPAEVDAYIADPRCGFRCTNQLWVDLLEGLHAIATSGFGHVRKDLPVYLLGGERDPVSKDGRGMRVLHERFRSAGLHRAELRLYAGGRHEMFNETNRDEVTRDLLGFLEKALT